MLLWQKVWRDAIGPMLNKGELEALRDGIKNDDPALIQGSTTVPPPLMAVQDWPVEAACALGYCFWKGGGMETVGETETAFAKACYEIDQRLGEPAGVRHFLNAFDETPRYELFPLLLAEVEASLSSYE